MAQYKTPGVYINEENGYSTSVTASETAVPVFIGFTEKAQHYIPDTDYIQSRISSLTEYIEYYGGAPDYQFEMTEVTDSNTEEDAFHTHITIDGKTYSIEQVGEKFNLYRALCLFFANGGGECYILSVGNYKDTFNKNKFLDGLKRLEKEEEPTMVVIPEAIHLTQEDCAQVQNAILQHCNTTQNKFGILDVYDGYKKRNSTDTDIIKEFRTTLGQEGRDYGAAYYPWLNTTIMQDSEIGESNLTPKSLALVKNKPEYQQVLDCIKSQLNVLPPSSAMAGVYTMVDNNRGVWKAPANVALSSVISPSVNISHDEQEDLNAPLNGEAVNAIRSFIGQGVLVWGARTLDGNSNDWRYINVRRMVIMLEQSIQKAMRPFVFEPNNANTWVHLKTIVNNFLINKWKQGALIGSTPEEAFSVQVGLGQTMTGDDIINGILRMQVLVSIIRPAEFIVLTFEQQMQE